ncbi:MAG: transglutaminase-like domain-containing protein [Gemmataceae bacterium]
MKGKKVGWTVDETKLARRGGRPVLVSTSDMAMVTLFDGEKSVKEEKTTTEYELTGDGAIVSAEVRRREDGKGVLLRAERRGDKLKITTTQGGRTLTREVPVPRDTVGHHRQLEAWLAGPRRKGDKFTKYAAGWEEAEIDSKQVYQFVGARPIVFKGVPTTALSVRIDMDGGNLDAVLLPDAHMLGGTIGGLLSMKLEDEQVAKAMDGKPVDLMPVTSVAIDTDLGRARDVDRLKLELRGVGEFQVPASHRQVIAPGKEATAVELRRDFRVEKGSPLTPKDRELYTRTTPRLQCDQEAVKALAKKLVGDEKDALKAARKIESWVYKTLRKSYSDNADTALEILDSKAGDCTEHSLLFVSLCRAAGLPAREVGGLAFTPGDKPMFGWHAWAEVHDGHQWVSVDPTWNQVYVDGTHLKMSTGERDLAWTNVIGTLKIKVIDVQSKR